MTSLTNPYNLASVDQSAKLLPEDQQYIGIGGIQIPVQLPAVPVQTEVSLSPQIKTMLYVGGGILVAKMLNLF